MSANHDAAAKRASAGPRHAQTPPAEKPGTSQATSTTSPVHAIVELPRSGTPASLLAGTLTHLPVDAACPGSAGALTDASTAALRIEGSLRSGAGDSAGLRKSADPSSSYKVPTSSPGTSTGASPESASKSGHPADLGVAGIQSARVQSTADALARMAPANFGDAADGTSVAGDSGAAHIPMTAGLNDQGNHASSPNGVALPATAMPQMPVRPELLVSLPNVAAELGPGATGLTLPAKALSSNPTSRSGALSETGMAEKESPHSGELRGKRKTEGKAGSSSTNAISDLLPKTKSVETSATTYRDAAAGRRSADFAEVQQQLPVSQMTASDQAGAPRANMAQVNGLAGQGHASAHASTGEATTLPAVNSAQLIQSMHRSEMRLGMQTAEFGKISISTSLNHQSLSTQISINHAELGRALAVHLPAIEEKLSAAYGLSARVQVHDENSFSGGTSGQPARGGSGEQGGRNGASVVTAFGQTNDRASSTGPVAAETTRLDIRI